MTQLRVLIAAPVRQKPEVLQCFLDSLTRIELGELSVSCAFVDDNVDECSRRMLDEFRFGDECAVIPVEPTGHYEKDSVTHHWREDLIWKVAQYKDWLIEVALDAAFDYVLFVDSDLVLDPHMLRRLVECDREVVSEVFWTNWRPGETLLPQVWQSGQYDLYRARREEVLSAVEVASRSWAAIGELHIPGLYRVGGLGACTLIRRSAMLKGARFSEIDNLSYWGEDRHFCIRARALGIELWADTHYPPLHLYRDEDVSRVPAFVEWSRRDRWSCPHITLSMVVRNESGRWLEQALYRHREMIDAAVIVDDASDDNTVAIVERALEGVPLTLVRNRRSSFGHEVDLRRMQWQHTVDTAPDWILNLDADELVDEGAALRLRELAARKSHRRIGFALHDMWDEIHYRDDAHWTAHRRLWPMMFRYTPFFDYAWRETSQHCGRFPQTIELFDPLHSGLRIQHMGWSREVDRLAKYERYMKLDPSGRNGSLGQYRSILDPAPNLSRWTAASFAVAGTLQTSSPVASKEHTAQSVA
jgi:glycosyltransferase involved in cell wall biosynthesis